MRYIFELVHHIAVNMFFRDQPDYPIEFIEKNQM